MDEHILPCPSCGAKNRIPPGRSAAEAKCGKCGAPLTIPPAKPVVVTDANFNTAVLQSPLPVLLDCWAPWCGPCRTVGPVVDELARRWRGRVTVGKLNVDENPGVASTYQIRSIPTLLIFSGGRVADTIVGAVPKDQIVRRMQPYLGA